MHHFELFHFQHRPPIDGPIPLLQLHLLYNGETVKPHCRATRLPCLGSCGLLSLDGLNPGHHLLLCDEMINPLQQTEQALHVS